MSSSSQSGQSGPEEERKLKRKQSNRDSARRSRMRKQQHLDELLGQVEQLKSENARISMQIGLLTQQLTGLDGNNSVLRAQVAELTERLRSLNNVLTFVSEFNGIVMDIPEIPEPWQMPGPAAYPITAAADMFQF